MPINGRKIIRPVSEEDIRNWEKVRSEMMVKIWQENILKLHIVDTMALHNNIRERVTDMGGQIQIAHEFMMYGIYVARGVGREFGNGYTDRLGRTYEFDRGGEGTTNSGQLPFLDKSNRRARGLNKKKKVGPAWGGRIAGGQPHKERNWFSTKYLASIHVLTEVETLLFGNAYMGTLSNVLDAMFNGVKVKGDKGTVVTPTLSRF